MKKNILSITATVFMTVSLMGQTNTVPNGDFETWNSSSYDVPQNYSGSNPSTFFRCSTPFNCIKTTDAYHGSYALQLTTNVGMNDTCMGYIVNTSNSGSGNPCNWPGGFAYNQTPTGLSGYYKSNVMVGDSAGILVAFKKNGSCIGLYLKKFGGVNSTYAPFTMNFSPALSVAPDTIVFAAVSSDIFSNIQKNGSMIQLDYLTFTGSVSQPANFNGDFENWQNQTLVKPSNWYISTDQTGAGFSRTTDAHAGVYAAELMSYIGDNNGNLTSRQGQLSTGYNLHNCNGPNCQKGGTPFTNSIDTLCFYYKYAPMGLDTAQAFVSFKYQGNITGGMGRQFFGNNSAYQYAEVPFSVGMPVDTIIVTFQSSSWLDSALTFAGSDFKVDDVHFKSQTTGIKAFKGNTLMSSVSPNPSNNGVFTIANIGTYDLIKVYNVIGQEENVRITKANGMATLQIENSGVYFVSINSQGQTAMLKIISTK